MTRQGTPGTSKWFQQGKKAQIDALAKVRRAMQ
jgi:hypothetical protein